MKTITRLVLLLALAMLPFVAQAQFNYTDNGDGTCTITNHTGSSNNATITNKINGFRVTSIGLGTCAECHNLTNVTIDANITNIGKAVFFDCWNLISATMPNTVTSIGAYAFCECYRLTNGTIPSSVTNIGEMAFRCTNLTSITISAIASSIGNFAFSWCYRLQEVYFRGNAPSFYGLSVLAGDNNPTVYYLPNTTRWDTFAGPTPVHWNPQALYDANFGVQANCFGFTITNAGNPTIVVDACSDLTNPVWTPVSTNTLTCGSPYFSDPQWTNYSARFYRFRSPYGGQ